MKDLRCVLGRHKYQERHTPDTHPSSKDGLYLECSRCGKQTDAQPSEYRADPMLPAELRWVAAARIRG